MITVKFAELPGGVTEFVLESGSTVGDLLEIANKSADGFTITVNAVAASRDTVLADGQNVILSKAAKGN